MEEADAAGVGRHGGERWRRIRDRGVENEGLVQVKEIDSNFAFNLGRGGGGLPALFTKLDLDVRLGARPREIHSYLHFIQQR
jgi:hypothetical protein